MEETTPQPTEQLTPRQQEVLALLREGLTNPQIAERLGVTLKAAEHHVAEVIGRLGVRNRYEAAMWPQRPPWWMAALAPLGLFLRRTSGALPVKASTAALAASGAALLVVVGGLGLIGVLLLRGSLAESATTGIDGPPRLSAPPLCPLWERVDPNTIFFYAIQSFEVPDERTVIVTPRPGMHDAVVAALRERQRELGSASVIALVGDELPNVVVQMVDQGDTNEPFDLLDREVAPIRVPCPEGAQPLPPGDAAPSDGDGDADNGSTFVPTPSAEGRSTGTAILTREEAIADLTDMLNGDNVLAQLLWEYQLKHPTWACIGNFSGANPVTTVAQDERGP